MTHEEWGKRLDDLEEQVDKMRAKGRITMVVQSVLWFLVPFTLLWAFGVESEVAVRLAVAPFAVFSTLTMFSVWLVSKLAAMWLGIARDRP